MSAPLISLLLLATPSKLTGVVVYPDRAQVIRAVTVPCAGATPARFEGLPPSLDPASFRARTDTGTVEGLRAEERTRDEAYSPRFEQVEDRLRVLDLEITAQRDALERAERRTRVGQHYGEVAARLVAREMTATKPDSKAWGAAFDASLGARLQAVADRTAARARLRELGEQREELQRERDRLLASAHRREYDAEVLVSCPAGKQARVELSYLVGGAGWVPSYEARADEAAGAVDFSTYATVTQATGEDWGQVRLTLSTAVPQQDATPPEIRPLKVGSYRQEENRKVLVRRDEIQQHAEAATTPAPASGETATRLVAKAQGLSVQLTAPEPADVPANGKPVRLLVGSQRLPARFAYRAVPKLMPFVFRVADATNSGAFPLLPGLLDAFGKSGFIARYPIERVPQGAPLHLTFGIDEALRVKRTVVEEIKRDTGLFGSSARFRYDYAFEVANYKGAPEELELSEHIPVSELDDVKVELEPKTSPGFEHRAQDGVLVWKVKLAPSETRKLELAFHVDVPSSYDNGGL